MRAGGHFNPLNQLHSGPNTLRRHVGDLGNILADEDGEVDTEVVDRAGLAALGGDLDITGLAIVIHEDEDDLGLGRDAGSIMTGNAGGRAGCCIITKYDL